MRQLYTMVFALLLSFQLSAQNPVDSIKTMTLEGVVVVGNSKKNIQMQTPLSVLSVNKTFIKENFSGSLMQSLEKIPGVKAMSIGSGQSKPAIRGLGFNRMIVVENGIKHEGQQWGEDHGLEIDQFSIDAIEVIKGPGSLLYGSDAIGGVINLNTNYIPQQDFGGSVNLFTRTNNESYGISAQLQGRQNKFFYKTQFTLIDYGDYKVPADSIQYYSYYIKLKDRRLRNTAGKEQNFRGSFGWLSDRFKSIFNISNVYAKSGFFADAHGLEVRLSDIDYDKSSRDIDYPYHSANHFKAANTSSWYLGDLFLKVNLSYQNNYMKELVEPVSHGYMPVPPDNLERRFDKDIYTANLQLDIRLGEKHDLTSGLSAEYQDNKRGGWGFIIPDFNTWSYGAFIYDRFHLSNNLILSGGIRFDHIRTQIDSYHDWYQTPVGNELVYKERAVDMERDFNSLSWSAGLNYDIRQWNLKVNIGKSFRAPIPKELGSDGINYHIFRYEKGDADLNAEKAYQIDAGINWNNGVFDIQLEPYFNYFPNYIYLNPTSDYYEGLQMYYYTQCKVLRYGAEAAIKYNVSEKIEIELLGEYLYARQLSGNKKGYPLPFSPPWSGTLGMTYKPKTRWSGHDGYISAECVITGKQDRIVPPEKKTDGHATLNLSAGRSFQVGNQTLRFSLQAQNILNKKYYDHTSYYRLIDVPEPGRNFSIMVSFDF
ncbi:MAG: TonB-dependent receptor [Clostridiaceae bacterium]|jgi:iron complex outermembrane receptor protein|nr:TonB-dependent receptor [Clostridiaceae bacterium]